MVNGFQSISARVLSLRKAWQTLNVSSSFFFCFFFSVLFHEVSFTGEWKQKKGYIEELVIVNTFSFISNRPSNFFAFDMVRTPTRLL